MEHGFSTALWITIAASITLFAGLTALDRQAWRLTSVVLAYLFLLGVLATLWLNAPARPLMPQLPIGWLSIHIGASIVTYGLLTIAAAAGLAVLVQERAIRRRRPSPVARMLPSIADSDRIQVRLLVACEIILGIGLISGMATLYEAANRVLAFDHKTLLSVLAFLVIGALLLAHRYAGLRGRRAARIILLAYLLLSLAYPGVKFVTDVLLA